MGSAALGQRSRLQAFSALRHSGFRRYYSGLVFSVLGFQVMVVAQGWLVYELTDSKLYLGFTGLAAGLPAIVLNLFGGVVADRVDQRRLLMMTQGTSSVLMFILATLTLLGLVAVWHILLVAFLIGSVQAFDMPTRQALFPHLIDREDMGAAVALNSMVWQGTAIIGPAIGGVIIGTRLGASPGFYAAFLGFLVMMVMISTVKLPPIRRAGGGTMAKNMLEGLTFVRTNSLFVFLIGMTFFNSVFGMSYIYLFPVFARDIFSAGPEGLGYLHSASGLGALLGTIVVASSLSHIQRRGFIVLGGAVLFGLFLILFAVASLLGAPLPLALALVFLAGVSTSVYMISVMSTLQLLVPDELRGRVMGIYGMTWSLMPVGGMQAGAIAEVTSAPFAVSLGGAAIILFAVGMTLGNRRVRQLSAESA